MSQPMLSILIPTVVGRERNLDALGEKINISVQKYGIIGYLFQLTGDGTDYKISFPDFVTPIIELRTWTDNKEMTIGEKRELLYKKANGVYSWQIDDDDDIADNAIELILEAIKQEPDCITFQEKCIIDGVEFKSNHSHEYHDWDGDGQKIFSDGFHYHRTPFFKSVIKTSIAQSVPIQHIRFSEDHYWARDLKPHLQTEIHIPENLYIYQHQSSDFNTRYGIK